MPSDLLPYAYHIYDWKTVKGRQELAARLRELLADVDQSPERPDNPVSDFLRGRSRPGAPVPHGRRQKRHAEAPQTPVEAPATTGGEAPTGHALAGPQSEGVDALALGREIASTRDPARLRAIVRLTRTFFGEEWPSLIERLNREPIKATRIPADEVYQHCLPYVERFAQDVQLVEAFGLPLVEAEYAAGLVEMFRILQDWITWSDKIWPGPSLKAITGAPGLLALRVLATWGAKAAEIMSPDVLATLLTHPLETAEATGQAVTLCLADRRDMFHPGGLLDRADLAVRYVQEEPWKNSDAVKMFASKQDYLDGLSRFLFLAALIHEARHPDEAWPLYPGFKLVHGTSRSVHAFVARISISPQLMDSLARMANEDVGTFRSNWPKRARRLNDAQLGDRYFTTSGRIPEEI